LKSGHLLSLAPILLLGFLFITFPQMGTFETLQRNDQKAHAPTARLHWPKPTGVTILLMGEDPTERFSANLQWAQQIGFRWIQITFPAYQSRYDSSSLPIEDHRSPSLTQISRAIEDARNAGMQVALQPLLLLQDPHDPHWRGQLKPVQPARWFRHYQQWIVSLAEIAQRHQVDLFFVGSELSSLEHDSESWLRIIKDVRHSFSGWVSYSANWDHWQQIGFASQLDALGLNGYIPLATTNDDRDEALVARWLPFRSRIHRWTRDSGIPVFFSELGFPSHSMGLKEPWNHTVIAPADPVIQARGYQSFLDTFSTDPLLQGVFFYALHMDGGEHDPSYTPAGKPAEELLRAYLQRGSGEPR